jgi:hypothetical protein
MRGDKGSSGRIVEFSDSVLEGSRDGSRLGLAASAGGGRAGVGSGGSQVGVGV